MLTTRRGPWPSSAFATFGALNVPRLVVLVALALIVYLPLENGLTGWIPTPFYWVIRFLPDAAIGALAVAVVALGDRSARTLPIRILWIVGLVSVALVAANAARSISVVDSVNALRVLVRYLVLGLLVWWAIGYSRRGAVGDVGAQVVAVVLAIGVVELAIVAVQLVIRGASAIASSSLTPSAFFFVDGTTGRYDRLGLFLMLVATVTLATLRTRDWRRIALLAAAVAVLYLTTSRQAMAGLVVAAAVLAVIPRPERVSRIFAAGVAAAAVGLILVTPSRLPSAPAADPDGPGPRPSEVITGKGSTQISTDSDKNFRLFYNLELAPWAAATEPLLGFGPGQQVAEHPDPRLVARVESTGMKWSFARRFTQDSNYASMVVQFGVIFPGLFLALVAAAALLAVRAAFSRSTTSTTLVVSVGVAAAVLVAAWFGPAFEIRPISIVFWVVLMTGVAAVLRREPAA